ncbi:MAG: translesion DNA synthesis-associated protein ImuA [Gammaproteobacteria bacterium]|nr:translesion DNA synthesis-associated protein ImuA [Gammaproteobacteria bacterium]
MASNPRQLRQLPSSAELWRARDLPSSARTAQSAGVPTGFEQLDRLLPGQGWPRAALSEILCDSAGIGELGLVAPGLARLSHEQARWITWINPPFVPHAPALAAAGIKVGKVLLIRTGQPGSGGQDALWALEQALESGACSAVLAWLDERRLRISDLRRLHLRAQHGCAWAALFRPGLASRNPSAAELRLRIRAAPAAEGGARRLLLSILKRRGGWGIDELPLELAAGDDSQALLRLWRRRKEGAH